MTVRPAPILRKGTLYLAAALATLVFPLYWLKIARKLDYTDFGVYYRAGARALQGDFGHVYDFALDGASPFRYAPPTLPVFEWLAHLPMTSARLLWFVLNFLGFGLGFFFLNRALRALRADALWITAAAFLFTLRFCLDTFTIGQISGLMFAGYGAALLGAATGRARWASAGTFLPAFLKIGPAIALLPLLASLTRGRRKRFVLGLLLLLTGLLALQALAIGHSLELWAGWWRVVLHDDVYYDASHYGNQSLKGALLRLAASGVLSAQAARALHGALVVVCVFGLAAFWSLRRPIGARGRALSYALGLFAVFWCMPETFKYSLTPLAIPVALLLAAERLGWLEAIALITGALTLSLPGKDVVGDGVFFGLQRASIPLLATFVLYVPVMRAAWRHSRSRFRREELGPWARLPERDPSQGFSLLVPLPLDSSSVIQTEEVIDTLGRVSRALEPLGAGEILLIPFGNRASSSHPELLEILRRSSGRVRALAPASANGRGAALRDGFLESRGRLILALQPEQPVNPEFYLAAAARILSAPAASPVLVRGNRRKAESRFRIPVRLLPWVYGRHRLGLLFNRLVRWLLPAVRTTDTQSGAWAASREFARQAFALQISTDFLAELELSLTAAGLGVREQEIAVRTELPQEKSPRRVAWESARIVLELPGLAWRFRQGFYAPAPLPTGITSDDWGISPGVNDGIVELARLGVIRRISVLADAPYAATRLHELKQIPGVELGLHFNLTYGPHALASSPGRFLAKWVLARGSARLALSREVRASLLRQLEKFESATGQAPAYLDGHHHIHLVPGLLDAVADLLKERGIQTLRLPYVPSLWLSSKAPLVLLSALASSAMQRHGFRTQPCLYPQRQHFYDAGRMRALLASDPSAEVIVHPASYDDIATLEHPDSYGAQRVAEFRALRMLAP